MKLTTLAANLVLVATAALASPLSDHKQAAMDAFRAKRSSRRSQASRASFDNTGEYADGQSNNWSGVAVYESGVTEVSGTLTAPQPKIPPGGDPNGTYCGVAWVGIDGWSNGDLIQTGILWCISENQSSWNPWYEYLPAPITFINDVTISGGSVVTVTATKTGNNSGITTLTVDGTTVSHTFSGESYSLPGSSAEWIVEDYTLNIGEQALVPFADFGNVAFTDASAVVNGATITPAEGSWFIIDMVQNGTTLTSTTLQGNSISVSYV
ncbi:peptidase G1 [Trichoderma chlorosporum]